MMDWLADMLQLPDEFRSGGQGGGVLQVYVGPPYVA